MKNPTRLRLAASLLVVALGAAACGGSDDPSDSNDASDPSSDAATGGSYSISLSNPENGLLPANTTESEGNQIMSGLFTGLVNYDPETTELAYTGVAESIEPDDDTQLNWTVKLNDGWTFHDGSPVTASSFVDAWNYGALSTNAQGGSYFFANFDGYEDLQAEVDEATGDITQPPVTDKMSGVTVVDDSTFTIQLATPFAQLPLVLGYTAFFPLPEAFFADPEGFGEQPIGNGPFTAATPYVQDQGMTLAKYEDYAGEPAPADEVEIQVIPDINTAYNEVQGGGLDILDVIPAEQITSAPDAFGDRFLERASSSFQYMGFPTYDPRFEDKRVRQALSMAIDRQGITDAIFNGTREPAYSVISPVVDGAREDACEYCVYDPEAAKALLAETDFDTSQPVDLWFNQGGGHDQWVTAVGNNLKTNLGIDFVLKGDLGFAEYLPLADDKGFTGPFRLGWAMDYPSPQNYLEPLYSTDAIPPNGSNTAFYSNPAFDALIVEGNGAADNDEAITAYQAAEDLLLEDMPVMPMFFGRVQAVHSEDVSNVIVDAFGTIRLELVTVNS